MPCTSGASRISGFTFRTTSGLSHDIVRSSPGSPASTPNRLHSPARCVARRSSSPNSLAWASVSKPRQSMTSQDVFDSGSPRFSDSIVTVLPTIDAVKALSSMPKDFPTRNFSHRRYIEGCHQASRSRRRGRLLVVATRRRRVHRSPRLSASNSRRASSSQMSDDQPYAAATAASRATCASASHCGRAL